MTPERVAANDAHDQTDAMLHDEIKRRAYELYERQHGGIERQDVRNEMQSEFSPVVYAAAQIQMSNHNPGNARAVRAARVYLRAVASFIAQS